MQGNRGAYWVKYVERFLLVVLWVVWDLLGCANHQIDSYPAQSVQLKIAEVSGEVVSAGRVSMSNGAEVLVENRGGVLYHRVEAILSPEAFSQLSVSNESVDHAIDQIFAQLESVHATGLKKYPELGYFTFDLPYQSHLMESLKQFRLPYEVWVDPVVYDLNGYGEVGSRGLSDGMTGQDRMRVAEFIAKAQQDIGGGLIVDGSSVRVGIADTGITLNHETFLSYQNGAYNGAMNRAVEGEERIVYMRDFTREGRVYFNPAAKFEVTPVEEDPELLMVNAEVIETLKLPLMPRGDEFKEVKDLKIRVSPELKQILMNPESGVKLGILYTELFQGKKGRPDLAGDGNLNTQFLLLYVPLGPSLGPGLAVGDVVYFDSRGNGDFRNARPLGDWNRTRATVNLFLERVGFDFQEETLPSLAEGKRVSVKSVSLVGFDPGGHGTHVAGILGGARNTADVQGIAPEVQILMSRVCSVNGGCNSPEALLDLVVKGNADVINMSLGSASAFNDGFGVQETLMNRMTSLYQVLFFVAAGNTGPGRQTVENPSTARLAISVGAAAHPHMIRTQYQRSASNGTSNGNGADDFMLLFSSRGPSAAGGMKPNLTAPGTALSAAPLNVTPGTLGGVKVISGTSMASPAAAGAYALLLDAIRKYNQTHSQAHSEAHLADPLPSDVFTLRTVLLHSARPFDVFRFDPESGERTEGRYTWIDQGFGMLDLVSAWDMLLKIKNNPMVSSVQQNSESIPLDYEVHVPMKSPNGNAYDGTELGGPGIPIYGSGLYLDYQSAGKFYPVYITRRLPEKYVTPALITQLRTTREEFVLKTIYYGSDVAWLKAGTLSLVDCDDSPVSNLMIYGEGATVNAKEQGPEALHALLASALNICVDRYKVRYALPPGDHGALISAYRVVDGQQSTIPSFTVPVYVTVPHHILKDSYRTEGRIRNFDSKKHYISIPEGSGQVKVLLEVPQIKTNQDGLPLPGQSCSGVELWVLNEENDNNPFKSRQEIVVSNCDEKGAPLPENVKKGAKRKRKATYTVSQPRGGIWDLIVVGSYSFFKSDYVLTAEYSSAPVVQETQETVDP